VPLGYGPYKVKFPQVPTSESQESLLPVGGSKAQQSIPQPTDFFHSVFAHTRVRGCAPCTQQIKQIWDTKGAKRKNYQ